jgi:chromosome segregation ATPase
MSEASQKSPSEIQRIVDEALDKMYAAGEKPTIRSLIERVGTDVISSTSTASKYKRDYDQRRQARENELFDRLGFSPEFANAFVKEVSRFSIDIESRAKRTVESLKSDNEELERELGRVEKVAKDFEALNHQKEKEIVELKKEIESLEKEHAHALESLDKDYRHQIETLTTKYETQLQESQKQQKSLTEKLEECNATIEQLRRELAQADLKLESLQSLESTNTELLGQVQALNNQLSEQKAEVVGLQKDVEARQNQISILESTNQKELAAKDREIEALRSAMENLQEMNASLREEVAEQKGEITSLNTQIKEYLKANQAK